MCLGVFVVNSLFPQPAKMLGGSYRRYLKVYSVNPLGIIRPKGKALPDVLEIKFPHMPVLRRFLEQETEKWRQFADSDEKKSA